MVRLPFGSRTRMMSPVLFVAMIVIVLNLKKCCLLYASIIHNLSELSRVFCRYSRIISKINILAFFIFLLLTWVAFYLHDQIARQGGKSLGWFKHN